MPRFGLYLTSVKIFALRFPRELLALPSERAFDAGFGLPLLVVEWNLFSSENTREDLLKRAFSLRVIRSVVREAASVNPIWFRTRGVEVEIEGEGDNL